MYSVVAVQRVICFSVDNCSIARGHNIIIIAVYTCLHIAYVYFNRLSRFVQIYNIQPFQKYIFYK